ncbi:putative CHA4 activatory protein [Dactylonectria macrodidyma]|uniref:CHA4 activatory protein n=1 Tax=Dactylonectria macrodidyma TaxID=307937 RepID=A0A9P9DK86_9HYPO|nr:putative CHA4 activatory protein [Dactylonectria macrodidyma]
MASSSSARPGRRYGFACLLCRRKKIRCDGDKPRCRNCLKAGDECAYKVSDGLVTDFYAQLRRSESRVKELEDGLRELVLLDGEGRDSLIASLAETDTPWSGPSTVGSGSVLEQQVVGASPENQLQQAELSVDEHGELHYFGATSRFLWNQEPTQPSNTSTSTEPHVDEAYHKKWLLSNSRFYATWEKRAHENLGQDPEDSLHNCVYKPCFFRDMALGGPYFSAFLLNVIYAHAGRHVKPDDARFVGFDRGEYFLSKAKLLLLDELSRERPSIPTIQGLLILGGRQCAVGKSSEGRLYTGMAIRMIKDLGLYLRKRDVILLEKLEPDDLEASKRLYLSAYAWDKYVNVNFMGFFT